MPGRFRLLALLGCVALAAGAAVPAHAQTSFLTFETGPVRPIALSPNGLRLFVTNIPDNRLEIFSVTANGLVHLANVPVGLEPCAVAARSNSEVWVVNHLSDSVSIVDVSTRRVKRTLLVGDEPRDIVITDPDGGGPLGQRAFITTAHRGQHRTDASLNPVAGLGADLVGGIPDGDPKLTTAGQDRADVWVFDAGSPGATLGGTPLGVVTMFGDTPRALAVSPDGGFVYAAVFHSGNQTAVVSEGRVCNGFGVAACAGDGVTSPNGIPGGQLPGGNPGPSTNHQGVLAPEVGLIVKFDNPSGQWRDEDNRNWSNGIRFNLPDKDVFRINASTLGITHEYRHAGTILFNMAVHPISGNLYVSNTDAQNLTRFEGPGIFGGSTVQGNLARSQITVITQPAGTVQARHLNKHIDDYSVLPAPAGTRDHSLATPVDMTVSSDGSTLYVAAFGSSKIGVFPTASLENDSFDPEALSSSYLDVSGGGPAGLALDETHDRLYVLTRFDNSVSVIDLGSGDETNHIPLHNPEPPQVVEGRPFLYDAFGTSSNGEASCSSCHIFGDMDSLSWDLGNPDDDVSENHQTINLVFAAGDQNGGASNTQFHPMKGPMTTQTLRGMVNSGHMHWRGDRTSGFCGEDDPHSNDSELSFKNFIVAFGGLVGDDAAILPADCNLFMQQFTDFALELVLPPNPVRNLNNVLTTAQANGANFFDGPRLSDGVNIIPGTTGFTCNGCHTTNAANGFFGTGGNASFENETQIVKIPHLRNMYQKVGMFGMPNVDFNLPGDTAHKGDQVRGTGYLHDGSTDTLFRFFQADVFQNAGGVGFDGGDPQRRDMEAFMLAFDTDLAPIVGQQVTLDAGNSGVVGPRITLLIQRAAANFTSKILGGTVKECELVVTGFASSGSRSWLYDPNTLLFNPDLTGEAALSDVALRAEAGTAFQELTYTCAPPGSGVRMALDRDEDGVRNRDEIAVGTDPANPGSRSGACNDGLDNDADGAFDLADAGCRDAAWNIENPQCVDGWDNDNDGLTDASDPQCAGTSWKNREAPPGCGLLGIEPLLLLGALRRRRQRAASPRSTYL